MIHLPTASHKIERRRMAQKWLTAWVYKGGRMAERDWGTGETRESEVFRTSNSKLHVPPVSRFTNDADGRALFAEIAWHDRRLD